MPVYIENRIVLIIEVVLAISFLRDDRVRWFDQFNCDFNIWFILLFVCVKAVVDVTYIDIMKKHIKWIMLVEVLFLQEDFSPTVLHQGDNELDREKKVAQIH